VRALEVAPAIGAQEAARILRLFAVAEQGAEHASHLRLPRQLAEGFRIGDADEFAGFGSVAEVAPLAADEEVGGRAVDQLEALGGNPLPVVGRRALADDAAGDGHELVVDVFDAKGIDQGADFLHAVHAGGILHITFQRGHGRLLGGGP